MTQLLKTGRVAVLTGATLLALSTNALADGMGGSVKDEAPAEGRKFSYSVTVGGTSDYVFRGVSQTLEDPAFQASIDVSYGIIYAGIWGSNVDLGLDDTAEVDLYAGIKPVWSSPLGEVTFDLGVLYYAYPGATDALEYVELKGGYSLPSPFIKNLTTGTTVYWSPDYSLNSGEVFTVESAASYVLPAVGIFTPSISGVYGTVYGDLDEGFTASGTNEDDYSYWNVGLSLAVEKFTFDFRYWDTDIDEASLAGIACTDVGLCDERFVFSAKVTLP